MGFIVGCNSDGSTPQSRRAVQAFLLGEPVSAQRQFTAMAQKPDQNYVLNNLRLGASALAAHDFDEAEAALVRAYEVLNATRVNDPGRRAAAVLFDEKIKIWRGEPYERAVANLYLGLIYYEQGDYQNARGAFENALFKLRDYGSEQQIKSGDYTTVENDFAIALLLLGRCWEKLGSPDNAQAQWAQLDQMRPDARELLQRTRDPLTNVMVVVDFGFGPRKTTEFDGSIVRFYPSPGEVGQIPRPVVRVNGSEPHSTTPLFDTVMMAQDRKWQSIDTIRVFKSGLGTALIAGGAITTGYGLNRDDGNTALIGLGLMAAGLLAKASSQADLRQWEMVPRTTFVIPLRVEPGPFELDIDFPDSPGLRQRWSGYIAPSPGGKDLLVYVRAMRFMAGEYTVRKPTDVPLILPAE